MKIITIVGARPQFVKAAMVSKAIQSKANLNEVLVHTGQHYDDYMSKQFFHDLEIRTPDYNLAVGSASHPKQTSKILETLEPILTKEKPDWVIVFGDTNSTLAGALAASQMNIPIAHVEAGLRSYNRSMPEERNRVIADHLASVLFAPTLEAVNNLKREGIEGENVQLVGDVMYDAVLFYSAKSDNRMDVLRRLSLSSSNYLLATVHRAENTDNLEKLSGIFEGLIKISKIMPVVIPLHPRTRKALQNADLLEMVENNLVVISPVGYLEMVILTKNAHAVATDSGGLQKEAYFFQKLCLTLREETEWVELIELGVNTLVGSDSTMIFNAFNSPGQEIQVKQGIYGDGDSAAKIVKHLLKYSS